MISLSIFCGWSYPHSNCGSGEADQNHDPKHWLKLNIMSRFPSSASWPAYLTSRGQTSGSWRMSVISPGQFVYFISGCRPFSLCTWIKSDTYLLGMPSRSCSSLSYLPTGNTQFIPCKLLQETGFHKAQTVQFFLYINSNIFCTQCSMLSYLILHFRVTIPGNRQCCGSEIIFFRSIFGSDFSGNFGSRFRSGSDLIYH